MYAIFVRRSLPNVLTTTVKALIFTHNCEPVRVSRCFSSLPGDAKHAFAVSYLMNSLGLSQHLAAKAVSTGRLKFQNPEKPESVLSFFEKHGFSKLQVRRIITMCPQVIKSRPEKSLLPKLQYFSSTGLSSSGLTILISTNPDILRRSLVKDIIPFHNLLKTIGCSDDCVFIALGRTGRMHRKDYQSRVLQNIAILQNYGVCQSNINRLVTWYPQTFSRSCDQFSEAVEEVKQMGFNPSQIFFLIAVNAKTSLSKATWEKKLNVYRKWGWSDEQVLLAFSKQPHCMKYSEEKINATMDFLVNKIGLESSVIARLPYTLSLSLRDRIIPRCMVLNALLSKGLLKEKTILSTFLKVTEEKFLQRYITCYENEAESLLKCFNERPDPATYKQERKIRLDGMEVKL